MPSYLEMMEHAHHTTAAAFKLKSLTVLHKFMTSVIGTALQIYNESERNAQEIAKRNGIPCTIKMPPLRFRSYPMKFSIQEYGTNSKTETSYPEIKVTLTGRKVLYGNTYYNFYLKKDHLLARFLLENLESGEKPRSVTLSLSPTKRFGMDSAKIRKIKGEYGTDILKCDTFEKELNLVIPEKSVDILDTIFHLYAEREPTLGDFLSREMIDGRTAEGNIKKLPEVPKTSVKFPEVKRKERSKFPADKVLETIMGYRSRAAKRHEDAKKKIKGIIGKYPTELACGTREMSFWKNDGYEFFGRIEEPGLFHPVLNSGKIIFPNKLPILAVGQYLKEEYRPPTEVELLVDDYLKANSALDMINEDEISVTAIRGVKQHYITKNQVRAIHLGKRGIRRLFDLASEISSVAS